MWVTLDEDESRIEVPSRQVEIKSRQLNGRGRSTFIDKPLPHPDYDFLPILGGGGFRATRKAD